MLIVTYSAGFGMFEMAGFVTVALDFLVLILISGKSFQLTGQTFG